MEAIKLGAYCSECEGNRENRIHGTLHYGGEWPDNVHTGSATVLPESDDGFNVFAVEWTAGKIAWFVDGVRYQTQTSKDWHTQAEPRGRDAPFDKAFHLIINLAIGGKWPEGNNDGGIHLSGFPKEMLIDWVRVYDCPLDQTTASACETE